MIYLFLIYFHLTGEPEAPICCVITGFPVKFFSYRITDVNGFDFIVYKIIYIHSKNHLLDDIKKRKFW
jgi:hypothetical protein